MRVSPVTYPFCVSVDVFSRSHLFNSARIYSHKMQTPTNLNNQQAWGGQDFRYIPEGSSGEADEQDHTFVLRERRESRLRPSSQAGFIASNSDDLFHPAPGGLCSRIFTLPDIPSHPTLRYHAYSQEMHTLRSRPLPHPFSFTSYNNPSFAIPPVISYYISHSSSS